ncbi:unnamed protein product [marine sediment metagenome]|uniref:Uncharacterized protein n=1 Tax=marine sediment metagenome TaxID=412755 RepID=X1AAA0_9ZZZZ
MAKKKKVKPGRVQSKRKKKRDDPLYNARNITAIISYLLVGISALFVILWYLNVLRL